MHARLLTYAIAFPKNRSHLAGALFKGYQLSGIVTFNTGLALSVTSSLGSDWGDMGLGGSSSAVLRPDRVADPNLNAPHTITQWFNTSAFAAVPAGQYRPGNAATTTVVGPGFQRWDASLFKNVNLREKLRLQVGVESFNLPNHTNFSGVTTGLGTTNFGQITSTRDPRRIQLGAKLIF